MKPKVKDILNSGWSRWTYLAAMIVANCGGPSERIGERQIDVVQQHAAIQIEGESNFRHSVGYRVHGVQDAANDEHFAHLNERGGWRWMMMMAKLNFTSTVCSWIGQVVKPKCCYYLFGWGRKRVVWGNYLVMVDADVPAVLNAQCVGVQLQTTDGNVRLKLRVNLLQNLHLNVWIK